MTAKRVVIAVAIVGFVALGAVLIGQQRAPAQQPAPAPQAAPAARVDVRSLVPRDVILYIEAKDLAATWAGIKAGPLYQELLQTAPGQQLQVLAAAVQAQSQATVGAPLDQVVTGLLGKQVILAAWRDQGTPVGALLSQVQDPTFVETVLASARQADVTAGKVARYDQQAYGNHTIYVKVPVSQQAEPEGPQPLSGQPPERSATSPEQSKEEEAPAAEAEVRGPLGRPRPVLSRVRERRAMAEAAGVARRGRQAAKLEYSVLCGNVLMVSDNLSALKLLIDRFDQPQPDSVLTNDALQAALGTLPPGPKAVAFVDFAKALAQVPLDEESLLGGKPAVAQFLGKQVLSVVRSLRQAVAGFYLNASGAEVQLRVTRDPSLLTDEMRAVLSQENVTPRALSYLSDNGVLLLSLPRLTAQMKLLGEALDTLRPTPAADLPEGVKAVEPLDLIFGRSFTREVLPGVGPEISLLVDAIPVSEEPAPGEEPAAGAGETPAKRLLPTAALFVQLSPELQPEVARLLQNTLGVAVATNRGQVRLLEAHRGETTAYIVQLQGNQAQTLRRLFQPTFALTDGFLVIASHPRALERALEAKGSGGAGAPEAGKFASRFLAEPGAPAVSAAGHIVLLADLGRAVDVLEAAEPLIVRLRSRETDQPQAQVARRVANAIAFLRPLAGQLAITVQHTPAETQASLRLRTATPLFAGEAPPQGR